MQPKTGRVRFTTMCAIALLAAGCLVLLSACSAARPTTSAGPGPEVAQDAAFSAAMRSSITEAVGTDYTLDFQPSDLAYFDGNMYRQAGWRRTTVMIARSVAQPAFAVYMRLEFDSVHPEFDPAQVVRLCAWRKVIETIPASRRRSFMEVCAAHWPYSPREGARHIDDILPLAAPGPNNVTPMPKGVPWQTGYRITWTTADQISGGGAAVAWKPSANGWMQLD